MVDIRWRKEGRDCWRSEKLDRRGEGWVITRDYDGFLLTFGGDNIGHSFGWYTLLKDAKQVAHCVNLLSKDFCV